MPRVVRLGTVVGAVVVLAVLSLVFASTGVRGDDPERNIAQPEELFLDLEIKVAYNDDDIFWRFRWPTDTPHFYHDYLVYENGEWVRYGSEPVGSEPMGLYEDRLTFFVDDGSVEGFAQYGGFITAFSGMRGLSDAADLTEQGAQEVEEILGEEDVRKLLPETVEGGDWRRQVDQQTLDALDERGYFLDLWHWRAHRSNPIGYADHQIVDYRRRGGEGEAPYDTNWNDDLEQPAYMFDPDEVGIHAMQWQRILDRDYTQDDIYYLYEGFATEFDPDHDWQNGDAIPRRLLQEPEGAPGSIFAQGIADNGHWNLDLQRALDTGFEGQKPLAHLGVYDMAFAVHLNATGGRWHYISMPRELGLERDADLTAVRFDDATPPWDDIEWTSVKMFYPGQIVWDYLTDGSQHAGAGAIRAGAPFEAAHDIEGMAYYALESEFRSEIKAQWVWTAIVWVLFLVAASLAIFRLARRVDPLAPRGQSVPGDGGDPPPPATTGRPTGSRE
jgi:hypothetical protein